MAIPMLKNINPKLRNILLIIAGVPLLYFAGKYSANSKNMAYLEEKIKQDHTQAVVNQMNSNQVYANQIAETSLDILAKNKLYSKKVNEKIFNIAAYQMAENPELLHRLPKQVQQKLKNQSLKESVENVYDGLKSGVEKITGN